jgi:hypothetical protein
LYKRLFSHQQVFLHCLIVLKDQKDSLGKGNLPSNIPLACLAIDINKAQSNGITLILQAASFAKMLPLHVEYLPHLLIAIEALNLADLWQIPGHLNITASNHHHHAIGCSN